MRRPSSTPPLSGQQGHRRPQGPADHPGGEAGDVLTVEFTVRGEAKRAFEPMMSMKKIDVAAIEAARLTRLTSVTNGVY